MALERKVTAEEMVRVVGMSTRPEYYSGRGAMLSDLNPRQLLQIHGMIKTVYGDGAAFGFVEMVANIKELSASDFLTCLYRLERKEWQYDGFQSDLLRGVAISQDEKGNYRKEEIFFGLTEALNQNRLNQTDFIRKPFLKSVRYKK